jgi:hypothetical protein
LSTGQLRKLQQHREVKSPGQGHRARIETQAVSEHDFTKRRGGKKKKEEGEGRAERRK